MTIQRFSNLETMLPLVDLEILHISRKVFAYTDEKSFPYNLMVAVLSQKRGSKDFFQVPSAGKKFRLKQGHIYLVPCNLPVYVHRTEDCETATLRFDMTMAHGADVYDGWDNIGEVKSQETTSKFSTFLSSADVGDIESALTIKSELMKLCLSCWPKREFRISRHYSEYGDVLAYVRKHGDASLSVSSLADRCGMRPDVFSRSFHRDLGVTPKDFINEIITKKISAYLLTTDLSVKAIASLLAFSSPYYLSRFFKTQTQLSPREFRNQYQDSI